MGVVLGNRECQDPLPVYRYCLDHGLPTDWASLPNRFMTSVGPAPGRGWLLMRRAEINALNIEALHDLTFSDNSGGQVTIKNLVFVRARNLTPSYPSSPDSCYLVDVRDVRHVMSNEFYGRPTFRQYNVRNRLETSTPSYYFQTTSDGLGTPYTWQTMLTDLWTLANFGVNAIGTGAALSPTIPAAAVPAANPEGFQFFSTHAWEAYNKVLHRVGCAFVLNPTTHAPSIVRLGATDTTFTTAEAIYNATRLLDDHVIESGRGKVPERVLVYNPIQDAQAGTETTIESGTSPGNWLCYHTGNSSAGTTPPYFLSQPSPTGVRPTAYQSGSAAVVIDDMTALWAYWSGAITAPNNSADIATRSSERQADYYRMNAGTGGSIMARTYIGIVNHPGFLPGSQVTGVCWRETGSGYVTDISRQPPPLRAGDDGQWQRPQDIDRLADSLIGRVGYPNYPEVSELVQVGSVSSQAQVYNGSLVRTNPSGLTRSTTTTIWVWATNGDLINSTGSPAMYYLARLNGVMTVSGVTRPLYIIDEIDGLTATQSFKDSAGTNKNFVIVAGRIQQVG